MEKVRTIEGVVDVDSNFEPTQPELRVNVNRARAADLGVNIDSLAANLRTLVSGEEVSEYKDGDDQILVTLRLDEPFRNNPVAWAICSFPRRPDARSRSATWPRSAKSGRPRRSTATTASGRSRSTRTSTTFRSAGEAAAREKVEELV